MELMLQKDFRKKEQPQFPPSPKPFNPHAPVIIGEGYPSLDQATVVEEEIKSESVTSESLNTPTVVTRKSLSKPAKKGSFRGKKGKKRAKKVDKSLLSVIKEDVDQEESPRTEMEFDKEGGSSDEETNEVPIDMRSPYEQMR